MSLFKSNTSPKLTRPNIATGPGIGIQSQSQDFWKLNPRIFRDFGIAHKTMFSKRFLGFQTTLEAFEDSLNLSECTHQPFINNIHPTYICNILSVCLFISYYISLHLLISSVFVIRSNNYISSLGKPPKLKVDVQTLFSDGILMAIMVTYDAN